MTTDRTATKEKRIENLKAFLRSFLIALIQGAISGGLGFLLTLIDAIALFGVLAIWFLFGWFTTYFIKLRTLEILTVAIFASLSSMLYYYLAGIPIWFVSIIVGLQILIWTISFITKILIFPKKTTEKASVIEQNGINEN